MKINEQSWLEITNYQKQLDSWPKAGKHVMAQRTDDYVVVYQAYRKSIGQFASKHQYFGGDFSYSRMSWIKTNFLWMMYRSGWGTKPNQEVVLAIFLTPEYFNDILENAFPSTNVLGVEHDVWKTKIANTDVRLQWDPDHAPNGDKQERRAIQLGLRNEFLLPFKGEGIVRIEDISAFVADQRKHVEAGRLDLLMTPVEHAIQVSEKAKQRLDI